MECLSVPFGIKLNQELEVITTVAIKSAIVWDISPCSPLKVYRRFGGQYHLYLQRWISRSKYHHKSRWNFREYIIWNFDKLSTEYTALNPRRVLFTDEWVLRLKLLIQVTVFCEMMPRSLPESTNISDEYASSKCYLSTRLLRCHVTEGTKLHIRTVRTKISSG
jgi:hypothetical protein